MESKPQPSLAAHRLPQELFRWFVYEAPSTFRVGQDTRKKEKRGLGTICLVCRYWAYYMRQAIFEDIQLRSGQDADLLLRFTRIKTMGRHIGQLVREVNIYLEIPSSSPPWAHRILHLLPQSSFPYIESIRVYVGSENTAHGSAASRSTNITSPRTPFHGLPRTLPFPAWVPTQEFVLTRLHFSHFAHLASFIASIPLKDGGLPPPLALHDVTWADADSLLEDENLATTVRLPPRMLRHVPDTELQSTSVPCHAILLFSRGRERDQVPADGGRSNVPLLRREDACRLLVLLQAMPDHEKSNIFPGYEHKLIYKAQEGCWLELAFTLSSQGFATEISVKHVDTLSRDEASSFLSELDKHASQFPPRMENVVVDLNGAFEERMVRAWMTILSRENKLVLQDPKPVKEKTQGTVDSPDSEGEREEEEEEEDSDHDFQCSEGWDTGSDSPADEAPSLSFVSAQEGSNWYVPGYVSSPHIQCNAKALTDERLYSSVVTARISGLVRTPAREFARRIVTGLIQYHIRRSITCVPRRPHQFPMSQIENEEYR